MYGINIYELAHKCKKWDIEQEYKITIEPYDYIEDETFSGTYWWVDYLKPKDFHQKCSCPNCGADKTEPEAIFKACQWVLENKDGS